MTKLDIVGLCGSLRAGSLHRMVLGLAAESMPAGLELEIAEYRDVPFFNADLMANGFPPAVTALRERIRRADGVVIATPEYNFSIPGVLKNALDWVSRGDDQPFAFKPVAILTASPGLLGGVRVQYELRRVMLFLNGQVLAKPEVFIGSAAAKFDREGRCIDDTTRKFVAEQMASFHRWILAVRRMASAD
jgi:chromate reductase